MHQRARFRFKTHELLTWFVDAYQNTLGLRRITTYFLISKDYYAAERLNQAWAPFKVPTIASHRSLNAIQEQFG